nr:ATP synthase F0 subunit 8 [Peronia verruculata]UZH97759.1 ATP synthase F0 subunit 8 [Peronia verruculata]
MPQLAPTSGYLIFFFIISCVALLTISNTKLVTNPKILKIKKSSNSPQF